MRAVNATPMAVTGSATKDGHPHAVVRTAELYAPRPKNAAWPSEIWPAYPMKRFRPRTTTVLTATRFRIPSCHGLARTSGTGNKATDRAITERPVRWRLANAGARAVVIATPPRPRET